jgi:hypothetical protein
VYAFSVDADPDPDVLSRIAAVCNLANVAPRRLSFERNADAGVQVSIELDGISASTADSIRRKLMQLTCVNRVNLQ